jgi:hypothetical protein
VYGAVQGMAVCYRKFVLFFVCDRTSGTGEKAETDHSGVAQDHSVGAGWRRASG